MKILQSKILNRLGVVEGKLKQNIAERGSMSNENFLLYGNLYSMTTQACSKQFILTSVNYKPLL